MFRKVLIAAAFAVTGLLLVGGPAAAQEAYPPDVPSVATPSSSVANGGSTTVAGAGWQPGTTVTLTVGGVQQTLGTAPVQSDGSFSADVTLPCLDSGSHTITVTGTGASGAAATASTMITVTGSCGDPGNGSLPRTGSDIASLFTLAAGLALLGAVMVIVMNRRRSAVEA